MDLVAAFAEKLDAAGVDVTETDKGLKVKLRATGPAPWMS